MRYLLDTSALLTFYYGEVGSHRVIAIIEDEHNELLLSVLSAAELWGRLRAQHVEDQFDSIWQRITAMIPTVVPVSWDIVRSSCDLRVSSSLRLPLIDALIAATALRHSAVLLHRDSHFAAIPSTLLRQEVLLY